MIRKLSALIMLASLVLYSASGDAQVSQQIDQYLNRGYGYTNKGDFDRAIADYTQAIQLNPKFSAAYLGRGYAYAKKGDLDRAIADYNEVIQINPTFVPAYDSRGKAYASNGDLDRAIADYTQAIQINPKYASAYKNRGDAYGNKGDFDRAIADYDQAIQLEPKNALAYQNRGNVYGRKGDLDRTISDSNQAIQINPKLDGAHHNLGKAYQLKGDLDRAIVAYTEAIQLNSKYAPSYIGRGLAYKNKGDAERADADYARARQLDPKTASVDGGKAQGKEAKPSASLRRVALIIGNSAYANVSQLPNPMRDAEVVAASLRSVGFQTVTVKGDMTRAQMIATLNDFSDQVANADWALVYFSGHGLELGGTNYVVPVDARLRADRDVQDEAVSLDRLLSATMGAKKLHIVILDACRDNPFLPKMRQTVATRSVGRGLARVEPEGATLVVYAARDGQIAYDGDGQNSPFVTSLVKRIAEPNVEINKLFRLVHDDVMAATGKRQEPYVYGALPGEDFFFVQK